jgi:hypothetical protein
MNALHQWVAEITPGRTWFQHGGIEHAALALSAVALRAGARWAVHAETQEGAPEAWEGLQQACRPFEDRLTTIIQDPHDGAALAQQVPVADIACVAHLFHMRDPYAVLYGAQRLARRHMVLGSCVIPADADGLRPGEQVAGRDVDDPRLAIVRRVLERRGIDLPQFHTPPDGRDRKGRPWWGGMWHWFQTEAALRAMIAAHGFRVTQRHATWEDVGLVLVVERD